MKTTRWAFLGLIGSVLLFTARYLGGASSCAPGWQGTVLIDAESLTNWVVESDTGSSGSLALAPGLVGQAVQLNWNLGLGSWVQGRYNFPAPIDLSQADIFGISLQGGGAGEKPNTVSIMFADVNNVFYGYTLDGKTAGVNQIDRWLINLPFPKKSLYYFFTTGGMTQTQIDWSRINRFFFVVKRPDAGLGGGTGQLKMDSLQYDRAAAWTRQTQFDSSTADGQVTSKAITYIRTQQKTTGLFPSWKEEETESPPPKAYLYDLSLVLIALTREGSWQNGAPGNEAARSAKSLVDFLTSVQKANGHWARVWNPNDGKELTDDGWVGDQAWWVMALAIYANKSGDSAALASGQKGAAWLASQIDAAGKVVTGTEGTLDTWWAMISTSRFADADKIKGYLLSSAVWDPDLRYFWRGFDDPAIAMDANAWSSVFARHPFVNQPERGKAALSFVRKTLVTSSADGSLCGFDGMGPVSVWNEGTAQFVAAGGVDAQTFLNMLISQQKPDGSMIGSPENRVTDAFGWLSRWTGLSSTAWLYFAVTGPPFPTSTFSNVPATGGASAGVAPDSLVSAFAGVGVRLATATLPAGEPPWPANLGGTTVSVSDSAGSVRPAVISFVTASQVNYVMPAGTALGPATVTITAGDGSAFYGSANVVKTAPGLFVLNPQNLVAANVVRVAGDGTQTREPVFQLDPSGNIVARPISLGPVTDRVYLEIYGTGGIRAGTPADLAATVTVTMAGVNMPMLAAVQQGQYPGMDQLNIGPLPRSLGDGDVVIQVMVAGILANPVHFTIAKQ